MSAWSRQYYVLEIGLYFEGKGREIALVNKEKGSLPDHLDKLQSRHRKDLRMQLCRPLKGLQTCFWNPLSLGLFEEAF